MISKRFLLFWWCLWFFLFHFFVLLEQRGPQKKKKVVIYISSSLSLCLTLRAQEKTPTLSTTRGLIHLETTHTCWNIYSFGRKHGGRKERQVSVDHRGAFKSSFFLLALYNRRSFCVWKDWTNFPTSFARSLSIARSEFRRAKFIFARMKDSGGIFSSAI